MGNVRRLIATISAQFGDLVDQVENHEAVAASALKKFRIQVQEAKVQARLMEKELDQAKTNKAISLKEAEVWKNRATQHGTVDREKALQCVKRLQAAEKEGEFWGRKEAELSEHVTSLRRELSVIENKHNDLKLEFQKYQTRERTAEVKGMATSSGGVEDTLQDVFDRWDRRILRKEVNHECSGPNLDEFANEMKAQEEALDLEETLNELLKQKE